MGSNRKSKFPQSIFSPNFLSARGKWSTYANNQRDRDSGTDDRDRPAKMGHDVTRTPNDWIPFDASDETQLLHTTAQSRSIFTFNVKDFLVLAQQYPQHGGIYPCCPE